MADSGTPRTDAKVEYSKQVFSRLYPSAKVYPVRDSLARTLERETIDLCAQLAAMTRERDNAQFLNDANQNLATQYREKAEAAERECESLRVALGTAIKEADGWFDECRSGECPGLDDGRKLLAGSKP